MNAHSWPHFVYTMYFYTSLLNMHVDEGDASDASVMHQLLRTRLTRLI